MRPIDGDRLKAVLDDTEKTLKNIDSMGRESWDIYISAVGDVFKLVREAIDRMPAMETREMKSTEMTLEEAILHCEEVAKDNFSRRDDKKCIKCGHEHMQLAEWLKELKTYREMNQE